MRDIGFDGVLLDADDDVPVSFIKKTLDILHEYNQRHVVLFRRIEGVESEFFQKISEGMLTNVIEAGESSPATKAVNFGSSHVKAAHQRTPSFEIKQMPKREFLETISKAVDLTDDEKKAVISGISDGAYTHCRFAKYLKDGKTSLEVEKCNPQKEIGKDADGHTMVEGGSGSVSVYEKVDGHWVPVVSTQYD